jgi:hypothetical protein
MHTAASAMASSACISSRKNTAPMPPLFATWPSSTSSTARSRSGSPLSAVPLAASTSSLAVKPPGTPTENAFRTPSAAVARARIRSRRLIDSSI